MSQMNRRSALKIGAGALCGAVAIPLTASTASAEEFRYRRIHEAAIALRTARDEIENAGHDFGGQKREALESIDRALHHLETMANWRR